MSEERFTILYHKYVADTLSPEEWQEWRRLFANEDYAQLFARLVGETATIDFHVAAGDLGDPETIFRAIIENKPGKILSAGSIRSMRNTWFKYAAILVLVLTGAISYWYYSSNADTGKTKYVSNHSSAAGAADEPVLILADGTKIRLDSMAQGLLVNESGAAIHKTATGAISYSSLSTASGSLAMNTIRTPKGRQYQVSLPDGSKVWLNAFTSIRFPAVFPADKRVVEIIGEAYFEIVPDKMRPFRVELGSGKSVQVLGTAFNVNNYADEPYYTTTLLEGSVKITSERNALVLKSGQTVSISESCQVVPGIDPQEQIAWKAGVFNLRGTDTRALLRQISRWYNVEVHYKNDTPRKVFEGKMGRDLSLSQIRKILNDFGIPNSLQGNKLIIE